MIVLSHHPLQSIARTETGQDAQVQEGPGKKFRFDFERFSSLPREVFQAFFSRHSD
jgi:hypothetical protein